jgi:hypothetical protein
MSAQTASISQIDSESSRWRVWMPCWSSDGMQACFQPSPGGLGAAGQPPLLPGAAGLVGQPGYRDGHPAKTSALAAGVGQRELRAAEHAEHRIPG